MISKINRRYAIVIAGTCLVIMASVLLKETMFPFTKKASSPSPTLMPTTAPSVTPIPTTTPLPTPLPTATPLPPSPSPTPLPSTAFESYFDEYSSKYSINKDLLKKIALCESEINPGAKNGPYGGMFQFTEETWQATRKSMGLDTNPDLRFDAKESIETAAYKIANGGKSAWLNCL